MPGCPKFSKLFLVVSRFGSRPGVGGFGVLVLAAWCRVCLTAEHLGTDAAEFADTCPPKQLQCYSQEHNCSSLEHAAWWLLRYVALFCQAVQWVLTAGIIEECA